MLNFFVRIRYTCIYDTIIIFDRLLRYAVTTVVNFRDEQKFTAFLL